MAKRAGALAVLVLTGETTAAAAAESNLPIDLIVPDLSVFGKRLNAARQK